MTYDELVKQVLAILPAAVFGVEDNGCQLLVYTGLREVEGVEELAEIEPWESWQ